MAAAAVLPWLTLSLSLACPASHPGYWLQWDCGGHQQAVTAPLGVRDVGREVGLVPVLQPQAVCQLWARRAWGST